MDVAWRYQIRVYLTDENAALARKDPADPVLEPLATVLTRHDAVMVSQVDAFQSYLDEAEREGSAGYPLYHWTKATLADSAKRAKHARTFALRVAGQELYDEVTASTLEADLKPLIGGSLVSSLTRHDSNPANNLAIPAEYRDLSAQLTKHPH